MMSMTAVPVRSFYVFLGSCPPPETGNVPLASGPDGEESTGGALKRGGGAGACGAFKDTQLFRW